MITITVKIGAQNAWQYIIEDARESPPTGVRFRIPGIISGGTPMGHDFNTKQIRGLSAPGATDQRSIANVQTSKHNYNWSVTYVPCKRISAPKYHFLHFFGCAMNNTSSTADAGAWTFGTTLTTALRFMTLFKEVDNMQHQLAGALIGRISVKGALDAPIEITADGPASLSTFADLARTDATTLRDATPFMWSDIAVYIDAALATFVTAFEFNLNNSAENIWALGDKNPQQAVPVARIVDVTLTRQYQDIAQYADARANTAKSITIRFTDTSGDTVDFRFRGCKLQGHPLPEAPPEEGVLVHELKYDVATFGAE